MLALLKKIKESTFKAIPIIVCLILMSAAVNFYITKEDVYSMKEYGKTVKQEHQEDQWETIANVLTLSDQISRENSKVLAQKMENGITSHFEDLNDLKRQFELQKFDPKFYDVLKDSIENGYTQNPLFPSPYKIFVASNSGVISVFTNDGTFKGQRKTILSWDNFFQLFPNPAAAKSSVDAIMDRKRDTFIIQTRIEGSQPDVTSKDRLTMDDLHSIYLKKGLKGLEDYNMYAPAYIKDDGDIFNTRDREFMKSTNNHKIYIIQSTNIGDLLDVHRATFTMQNSHYKNTERYVDEYVAHKTVQTILWSFLLFILSIVLIFVYNHESKRSCHTACKHEEQNNREK